MFALLAAIVMIAVSACTYTRDFGTEKVTIKEESDGTRTMTIERNNGGDRLEMDITGKSRREVKRMIPFPLMDFDSSSSMTNPVVFEYRYEYRFEVFDINGNYVDTISVETYDDFVAMMPVAFALGGFPMPSQDTLDAMAADLLIYWVDPETDWHNYN